MDYDSASIRCEFQPQSTILGSIRCEFQPQSTILGSIRCEFQPQSTILGSIRSVVHMLETSKYLALGTNISTDHEAGLGTYRRT